MTSVLPKKAYQAQYENISPDTFLNNLSKSDKFIYAQAKRFMEWYEGSSEFRDEVRSGNLSEKYVSELLDVGVSSEVTADMSTLWSDEFTNSLYTQMCSHEPLQESFSQKLSHIPIAPRLYLTYKMIFREFGFEHRKRAFELSGDSDFYAWRKRRLYATQSELGWYGASIDHPIFSIELGVGCTVGCTFCAFDAQKHETNFSYDSDENKELFRAVAHSLKDILGLPGGYHGMLYYATEPNDNPNYLDFMQEFYEITGGKLCTSTARYDTKWAEDLIEFYSSPQPASWPRFSVLSHHCTKKLHKHFSPEEFMYPWILAQSIEMEDERQKVPGGREKYGMEKLKSVVDARHASSQDEVDTSIIPQGSIACVTGFKINMINKTITATSPCYTSQKWSKGYRDYGVETFTTPDSVRPAFDRLIAKVMKSSLDFSKKFEWRDDLEYRSVENGFQLVSPYIFYTFNNKHVYSIFDSLKTDKNTFTFDQLRDKLVSSDSDMNYFSASVFLESFWKRGFVSELD